MAGLLGATSVAGLNREMRTVMVSPSVPAGIIDVVPPIGGISLPQVQVANRPQLGGRIPRSRVRLRCLLKCKIKLAVRDVVPEPSRLEVRTTTVGSRSGQKCSPQWKSRRRFPATDMSAVHIGNFRLHHCRGFTYKGLLVAPTIREGDLHLNCLANVVRMEGIRRISLHLKMLKCQSFRSVRIHW